MPNWCNNSVVVKHADIQKLEALADAFAEGKFCSAVMPVPEDLTRMGSESYSQGELGEKYDAVRKENIARHGYKSWYDFCVFKWGTKWDVGGDLCDWSLDSDGLRLGFETAWTPPIGIYAELTRQGFEVRALYYEPGMDLAGCYRSAEGDNRMDVQAALSSDLGKDLDDAFNILDNMETTDEEE